MLFDVEMRAMNGRLSATSMVSRIDCVLDFGFIQRRYNGTSGGEKPVTIWVL